MSYTDDIDNLRTLQPILSLASNVVMAEVISSPTATSALDETLDLNGATQINCNAHAKGGAYLQTEENRFSSTD